MIQYMMYYTSAFLTLSVLLYGLYCFLFPRLRARLSLWRLGYRIFARVRKLPAQPVARWRVWWARGVGVVCLTLALIWLASLHPRLSIFPRPLYDPAVDHWSVLEGEPAPEDERVLKLLDATVRKVADREAGMSADEWALSMGRVGMCTSMCAGVVYGGRSYVIGVGEKQLGIPNPPDADTVFQIGSISKTFTGTALATLLDDGTVGLADPVAELLPGWSMPSWGETHITLKHLATHRSGLPRMPEVPMPGAWMDYLLLRGLADPYRNGTPEYLRRYLGEHRLQRAPDAECEYSNLGFGLLGYALRQKLNQPYEEMVAQRVLWPLEMHDTSIRMLPGQEERFAQGFAGPYSLGSLQLRFPVRPWSSTEAFQGCGAFHSTVRDMLKYLRANIAAPEGPLGAALEGMQKPQMEMPGMPEGRIGLAMMSMCIPNIEGSLFWHNGGTGGYNSYLIFSKQHKLGVVILATGACDEELAVELLYALTQPAA